MKLNIVAARHGVVWARLGVQTFFKQPMAMAGMFFMFLAIMSLMSIVPLAGNMLALTVMPGLTMGIIAGTHKAAQGKFPMPLMLFQAFRSGQRPLRAILTLGAMYAVGFIVVLACSALIDGGQFARLYLMGGGLTEEAVRRDDFVLAVLTAMSLYIPLSMMFWHAPALVYWHGISPTKSLFFSLVACWRNMGAFLVYSVMWILGSTGLAMTIVLIGAALDSPDLVGFLIFPGIMLVAAMFFSSIFFTFVDCFESPQKETP